MKISLCRAVFLIALFFLPSVSSPAAARKVKSNPGSSAVRSSSGSGENSFASPDFAFPRDVKANAVGELDKAIRNGNSLDALQAAVQLSVADNLVSRDSVASVLSQFNRLSSALPAPYSQLASLLEARLYVDIYQSNKWAIDERRLPSGDIPEDPSLWSAGMFESKVRSLCSDAFDGLPSQFRCLPLSHFYPVIKWDGNNGISPDDEGFLLYDFVGLQVIDLLSNFRSDSDKRIPFGDSQSAHALDLSSSSLSADYIADRLVNFNFAEDPESLAMGRMWVLKSSYMPDDERPAYLAGLLRRRPLSEALIPVAQRYFFQSLMKWWSEALPSPSVFSEEVNGTGENVPLSAREFFKLISELKVSVGNSSAVGVLDSMISSMKSEAMLMDGKTSLRYPEREFSVTMSRRNVAKGYLLVFRLPDSASERNIKNIGEALSLASLSKAILLPQANAEVPFVDTCRVAVPALSAGRYFFVLSSDDSAKGVFKSQLAAYPSFLDVSSIDMLCVDTPEAFGHLYVVDGITQRPVKGATVSFLESAGRNSKSRSAVTDADGRVAVPFRACRATASYKGSRISDYIYCGRSASVSNESQSAGVFTDLGIYHPGDSVRFAAVVTRLKDSRVSLVKNSKVWAILRDANYQAVDSLSLTTDAYGRVNGVLSTPDAGLLGRWQLQIALNPPSSRRFTYLGSAGFQVADYKAPSFMVTVDSVPPASGDMLRFSGSVVSYSGMPLADSKIDYTIEYAPLWSPWRRDTSGASFSSTSATDSRGRFSISLPTAALKGTRYEKGRYILRVSASSPSGETCEAPAVMFSLGNALRVVSSVPERVHVDGDKVDFSFKVVDLLEHPVVKDLNYTLRDSKDVVISSGTFKSPLLSIPADSLPSGRYSLVVSLPSSDGVGDLPSDSVSAGFVAWRSSDEIPPVATSLWVPVDRIVADAGVSKVKMAVGSGFQDNWVLMVVSDSRSRTLSQKWLRPKGRMMEVEVPAPDDNSRVYVSFSGLHDFKGTDRVVTVLPHVAASQLSVKASSFRNRIFPGADEHWTFRFFRDGKPAGVVPAFAVMSDKALDALAPFSWSYNPQTSVSFFNPASLSFVNDGSIYLRVVPSRFSRIDPFSQPSFNFYGYTLYGGNSFSGLNRKLMVRGVASNKMESGEVVFEETSATIISPSYAAGAAEMEAEVSMDSAEAAPDPSPDSGMSGEEVALRPAEMPLAFFMPSLLSDSESTLALDFKVPDFNTTWKLQVLGYSDDPLLLSCSTTLEAVASKKVMVHAQVPQFLRTSDEVNLKATLFNNSDSPLEVGGVIRVVDPVSGKVVVEKSFEPQMVEASANRIVSISLSVPSDIQVLRIVAIAESSDFSDGEQVDIPVLPASSPVVEATPFYLSPGSALYSVKLPKFDKDAVVTLKFCDNPVWFCLTALPDIVVPDSESAMSLADALYANAMASGLISGNENLRRGLELALSESARGNSLLHSPLEKDAALKSVVLANTPWLNNASAETMRMMRLSSLLDRKGADRAVDAVWNRLLKLRNSDGGFSWCPGMNSSLYMTSRVLYNVGMLRQAGYLPAIRSLEDDVRRAVAFCDSEVVRDYKLNKSSFNPESLLDYLFVRSFFSIPDDGADFYKVRSLSLAAVMKGWKKYDIHSKATAAILLWREGHKSEARSILESLSQYSSYKSDKGRWYDNLRSSWNAAPKLLVTTRVLEAFSEIDPSSPQISQICQWLVLQRETQDWGSLRNTAEVVNAVLSASPEWTAGSSDAVLSLGGNVISPSERETLTGAFTISISPEEASGQVLDVRKSTGGPSWGGVISQYVAPISEVKAASVPDLSLSKKFYLIKGDDASEAVAVDGSYRFKAGDRVRVTFNITCGRDMDYVALTDERPACFSPSDQVSGYTSSDRLFFYREVRSASTSLFFSYLPKGKYVVSYDVFVTQEGTYAAGVSTIQSQYAPMQVAHTSGAEVRVF